MSGKNAAKIAVAGAAMLSHIFYCHRLAEVKIHIFDGLTENGIVGHAEEWVADWYSKSYESCGKDCEGIDPKGPCHGDDGKKCGSTHAKVVRGGAWYWPEDHATGIHRRSHLATNNPGHHFGFRCAASVEEMEKLTKKSPTP